jgi:hypothetical protein
MRDDDRIDFAALDPARDRVRWERMMGDVATRALARRRRGVGAQLGAWARPALALAACVALFVWGAVVVRGPRPGPVSTDAAYELVGWARADHVPDEARSVLEVDDVR